MSHLRPDERIRHRMSSCRRGRHYYGAAQNIGAGIERQVCEVCGSVSIDLTQTETITEPLIRIKRQALRARR